MVRLLVAIIALSAALPFASAAQDDWSAVVERVSKAVVALEVAAAKPFDTQPAGVSQATGFVVDAERGLILTNRHVVQPGPVTAHAVFLNHERVRVWPIYRDPVHDFGLFRFDPGELKFLDPGALPLAPEAAQVGAEIRVIGNDAGEKLSILAGTLARVDRDAPRYGRGRYNDFNTFYLQAASSSSGGSSGSPVVDRRGRVIGLNAGGSASAATSFFLPLDRVARVLSLIQQGEPVRRGTLQTVWVRESYDELRRLGLREETEARVRAEHPEALGLLVAGQIVPGGPADGVLEPGDVLVAVDGEPVVGFAELEARLDDPKGERVRVDVERGGEPMSHELAVGDLHAVSPDEYLEFGGGVLHPLSYQMARSFGIPARGVYLAAQGYAFRRSDIPARVVVTHVNEVAIADLDGFESALDSWPHGAALRLRYFQVASPRSPRFGVLRVDRRWNAMRRCRRDDALGLWSCTSSAPAPPAGSPGPVSVGLDSPGPGPVPRLARSLVLVRFDLPFTLDGAQGNTFVGGGLVVDAEKGWVVVDRDTVPVTLGDLEIVFGGAAQVPARVLSIHPEHNLALVAYDPAQLEDTPVTTARFDYDALDPGDEVWQVVLTGTHQLLSRRSTVERIGAPRLPIPGTPRFRERNVDLISLTDSLGGVGGVLADRRGRVRGLWSSFSWEPSGKPESFFAGVPAATLRTWLDSADAEGRMHWQTLGIELSTVPLSDARQAGLPDEIARVLEAHDARSRVLAVARKTADVPASAALQVGDFIVRVNGKSATRFERIERAVQAGPVEIEWVRAGERRTATFTGELSPAPSADRVVIWSGAMLQEVPATLASQRGLPRTGVYVAGRWRGSPADAFSLGPTRRIVAVDGIPTPNLDAFLEVLARRGGARSVRLRVIGLDGKVSALTLEPDLHYWPARELRRGPNGWRAVAPRPSREKTEGAPDDRME
jgi:S1-C subfamily serine protease